MTEPEDKQNSTWSERSRRLSRRFSISEYIQEGETVHPFTLYCHLVGNRPCTVIIFYTVFTLACMGSRFRMFDFVMDFTSMAQSEGDATQRSQMYMASKDGAVDPSVSAIDAALRSFSPNSSVVKRIAEKTAKLVNASLKEPPVWQWINYIDFIYVAVEGDIMSKEALSEVRDFENGLINGDRWRKLCGKAKRGYRYQCEPGMSLMAYAWPTLLLEEGNISQHSHTHLFDGNGSRPLQLQFLREILAAGLGGFDDLLFSKDSLRNQNLQSGIGIPQLRSAFGFPISGNTAPDESPSSVNGQYKKVCAEAYDYYKKVRMKYKHIMVYMPGGWVLRTEQFEGAMNDSLKIVVSFILVLSYIFFITKSAFVTISAILLILCSVPVAFVLSGLDVFHIAYMFAVFLMLGIGSDTVFVFFENFKRSGEWTSEWHERVMFTIANSAHACFATSLTTAMSLFANLASAFKMLREFGYYMGLCVIVSYFLILTAFPPILVLGYRGCCKCRHKVSILPKSIGIQDSSQETLGKRAKPSRVSLFDRFIVLVVARSKSITAIAFVSGIAFTIGIAMTFELDMEPPAVFPDDHTSVVSNKLKKQFNNLAQHLPHPTRSRNDSFLRVESCPLHNLTASSCGFRLCDLEFGDDAPTAFGPSLGSCWWSDGSRNDDERRDLLSGCTQVTMQTRIVGRSMPNSSAWRQRLGDALLAATEFPVINSSASQGMKVESLVILEDWHTGHTEFRKLFDMGSIMVLDSDIHAKIHVSCEVNALCFDGPQRCNLPHAWKLMDTYSPTSELHRRLTNQVIVPNETVVSSEHQLTSDIVAGKQAVVPLVARPSGGRSATNSHSGKKTIKILLVWGLQPPSAFSHPLIGPPLEKTYDFDPAFDPENPWAQRSLYSMCFVKNYPRYLGVVGTNCAWLEAFRAWLQSNSYRFPSRRLTNDLIGYHLTQRPIFKHSQIWMSKDKIAAMALAVTGSLDDKAQPQQELQYMRTWDKYLKVWSQTASVTVNRPFALTEYDWPEAEHFVLVMWGTIETVLIALASAFFSTLFFACDLRASVFVSLVVFWSVIGLVFCITVVFQLPVGPIEVIGIIFFIGYAVTYSLHIAHAYAGAKPIQNKRQGQEFETDDVSEETKESSDEDEELSEESAPNTPTVSEIRVGKVRAAMRGRANATMSSAASTIIACIVLFFSDALIFIRLAAILVTVTFFSIIGALAILPAMMTEAGSYRESLWRRLLQSFRLAGKSTISSLKKQPVQPLHTINVHMESPRAPLTGPPFEVHLAEPSAEPPPRPPAEAPPKTHARPLSEKTPLVLPPVEPPPEQPQELLPELPLAPLLTHGLGATRLHSAEDLPVAPHGTARVSTAL